MEHRQPRGALGTFPEGKLNEADEGALEMGVADDGQLVHVNFGKPIEWFAVKPDLALKLASLLTGAAMRCKRGK
jgi:hypothetical protein